MGTTDIFVLVCMDLSYALLDKYYQEMMGWQHPKIPITMTWCELCIPTTRLIQDLQASELYRPLASTIYAVAASGDLLRGDLYRSHSAHFPTYSLHFLFKMYYSYHHNSVDPHWNSYSQSCI